MNQNYSAASISLFFAWAIGTMAAQAAGPSADYKIHPEYTVTSPDSTTTIEQYAKISADGDYTWQFWTSADLMSLVNSVSVPFVASYYRALRHSAATPLTNAGNGELLPI